MDAKAKVVAWEVVRYDRHDKESREVVLAPLTDDTVLDDGDEAFALMRVTDHEAALAELREQCVNWQSAAGQYKAELLESELRISTLLTGLEALAGEWIAKADDYEAKSEASDCRVTKEWFEGMAEGHIDCANALTRTLASAGLEGNGNE